MALVGVVLLPVEAPELGAAGGAAAALIAASYAGVATDLQHEHTAAADVDDVYARGLICAFHKYIRGLRFIAKSGGNGKPLTAEKRITDFLN